MQTIFSMDFFSVTVPAKGMVPIFNNAVYSWVYFAIVGIISTLVFGWWGYKHHELRSQHRAQGTKERKDDEEVDTDESALASQKSLSASQNKLLAAIVRQAAINSSRG